VTRHYWPVSVFGQSVDRTVVSQSQYDSHARYMSLPSFVCHADALNNNNNNNNKASTNMLTTFKVSRSAQNVSPIVLSF